MSQTLIHLPLEGFHGQVLRDGRPVAYGENPWAQPRILCLSRTVTDAGVDDVLVTGTLHEMRRFLLDALTAVNAEIGAVADVYGTA